MFDLTTPIEKLYLVGPVRARLLKKLEINTLADLLFYFPRTHQDLSHFTPIAQVKPSEFVSIKGRVLEIKSFRTKVKRLTLTHALVEDGTGSIVCVWYNQPFLTRVIKSHEVFFLAGKAVLDKNKLILQNPIYEQEKPEQIHTARLVPVYPLTANLTQKQLRTVIKTYLDKVKIFEYLPAFILRQENFLTLDQAVKTFHFPKDYESLHQAQQRLAFDEIFQTQIRVLQYKKLRQKQNILSIKIDHALETKIKSLPFELTSSQKQALHEILTDFKKPYPANRLLEGDVGSGKTVVAALIMWLFAKQGLQASLVAPTEVLASQHFENLVKFFQDDRISTALLTSSRQKINWQNVAKQELLAKLKLGQIQVVFGTHALLEQQVNFKNLSLAVIDEQHRFGVEQRSILKQIHHTHLLTMSATPIPRTLALTLYGDLDISILSQLPIGRIKVKTKLVSEAERAQTYQFITEEITTGRQAFVICPLIEESDRLGVKSATKEFEKLSKEIFPHLKIGLLHGKLKPKEKEGVMRKFNDNEIQILVTTSVVEVGVDMPNATVMMIEGSERFGLAQLHQFRGRVGRSNFQSYCFLFSNDPNAAENPRLKAIGASTNGFELAEKDLQIRGGGDLYGTTQSGYQFRIANLTNLPLVEKSKEYAEKLLDLDPSLANFPLLKQKIQTQPLVHLE